MKKGAFNPVVVALCAFLTVVCSLAEEAVVQLELQSKDVKESSVRILDKDHVKFEFLSKNSDEIKNTYQPFIGHYVTLIIDGNAITDKIQVTTLSRGTNFIGLVLYFSKGTNQMQEAAKALMGQKRE